MRQKPLPTLGQRGLQRRRGQAKISGHKTKVNITQNYDHQMFDEEAMHNLYSFFDILLKIDREQKINQHLHDSQS